MTSTDCPQILDSKEIFRGRVFDVTVDTIREGRQNLPARSRASPRQRGHRSSI